MVLIPQEDRHVYHQPHHSGNCLRYRKSPSQANPRYQVSNYVYQCGLGLYVSGKSIHDSSSKASWTCASNAI
jgi:hypothetical protein